MEKSDYSISNNSIMKSESEGKKLDEFETYEIQAAMESINYFNKEHSKENKKRKDAGNVPICTTIKDIDWLGDIFENKDLKNMLIQNIHIREILIDQALYYFYIFNKIFMTWYKEKETEKLVKEEEKEREKQIQKYHVTLPPIDMKKILKKINIPAAKVGIIGGGNIGKKLLKNLIKIKDKNIFKFQIFLSTRQPDKIINEFLEIMDDDIHIILNNEKIFEECDIIFLCIQPMQLDLLSKEINHVFSERIEKLSKREYKFYPLIVSFLSATPVKRLQMFFPKNVHILRTRLLYNFLRSKKKQLFSGSSEVEDDGEYIEESCDHLLEKEKCIEVLENLIIGLIKQFYNENNNKRHKNEIKESPMFLFEVIFGKNLAMKYHDLFSLEKEKFIINYGEEIDNEKKTLNNEENINNEEENEEIIKIRKDFGHNIGNDFKNIFISYLNELFK